MLARAVFPVIAAAFPALASAQTTNWLGGTGNWSNGLLWDNGVPNSNTFDARIDNGLTGTNSAVSIDGSYTVGLLEIDTGDSASLNNAQTFILDATWFVGAGVLTNNGTFTINGGGSLTDFRIKGNSSLLGSGTFTLANPNSRLYASNTTDRLTVGSSQTINGQGLVGIGWLSLTNNGLIDANQTSASLTLQPNGSTDFSNGAFGIMQASSGGILVLKSGTFLNSGTIQALTGSTVNLNTPTINGGFLTTAGTGEIHNTNSATLTSVTNNGKFIADNSTITYVKDGLTNNSTLSINGGGSLTDLRILNPLTIGGTGTITLANANSRVWASNTTDRLTVGSSQTINGQGQIGIGYLALTNNGLIDANQSGASLTLQPNGSLDFTNAATGTWQASNGGTMTLQNGKFINNGTVQALDNSTVTFGTGANLTNNSSGTLSGGVYKAISTANAATVNLSGGNVVNNAAGVYLSGALSSIPQINTLASNLSGGEFHVQGGRNFSTAGALSNAGTVEVGGGPLGSVLTVNGNYTQTAGSTIVNGDLATSGGSVSLLGGTLQGSGIVAAAVNNSAGTVSPGNSPGMLSLVGDYTQGSGGALDIQLAGTAPGSQYDVLSITGGAALDGALNVSLLSFTPTFGETFTILTTTTGLGGTTFAAANLPTGLLLSYTPTSVVLTAIPEPASLGLLTMFGAFCLLPRKRVRM